MASRYRTQQFIYHGVIMIMHALTQGFYLGYLMNTTPNPQQDQLVIQALAAHRTGWMSGVWMITIGLTNEYCDLSPSLETWMYRLLVYQAYHQAFLNDYYTALGIVGGRMPIVLTSNMINNVAVILAVTYAPIVYTGAILWFIGIHRKLTNMVKDKL